MNIVKLPKGPRRSTWANKHLEFIETAASQIVSHLRSLGDAQFWVEHEALVSEISAAQDTLANRFLLDIYEQECARRPPRKVLASANDLGEIPF